MALKASDVFVVQQAAGAQALAKVSAFELSEWIETSGGVHYVGVRDFTNSAQEPASPLIGDLYLNNTGGDFAWTYPNTGTQLPIVFPNDKAVWNGTFWDLIGADSDNGISSIQAIDPLYVTADGFDFANPIIGIRDATTSLKGSVTLASQTDVDNGDASKVVTADLLASVAAELEDLELEVNSLGAGTVTSVVSAEPGDPITITNSTTTPTIAIKDGTTTAKGVVTLASSLDILNKSSDRVVTADQLPEPITAIDGGIYALSDLQDEEWSSFINGVAISGYPKTNAFDGVINTIDSRCVPSSGTTCQFVPPNEITGAVVVWVTRTSSALSPGVFTVNGNDYTGLVNAAFHSGEIDIAFAVEIPETSINNTEGIAWKNNSFLDFVGLAAVEVGGALLIDKE